MPEKGRGLSLRFEGSIPKGKFEFTCVCGEYSGFNDNLSGENQTVACEKCGTEYMFVRQETHYHVYVNVVRAKKSEVLVGLNEKVAEVILAINESKAFNIYIYDFECYIIGNQPVITLNNLQRAEWRMGINVIDRGQIEKELKKRLIDKFKLEAAVVVRYPAVVVRYPYIRRK